MRYDNPGDPVYAPNFFGGPAAASAPEVSAQTQACVAEYWRGVHPELGAQVAKGLADG